MIKKLSLLSSILILGYPAFASINNNYQYGQTATIDEESVVLPITNQSITLKPEIDAINPNDPRIKTLIEYVKNKNGMGVSVIFSNPENLRYTKKLNQMFAANGVYTTDPQLTKSKNAMDFNTVKIYVIKYPGMLIESSTYKFDTPKK